MKRFKMQHLGKLLIVLGLICLALPLIARLALHYVEGAVLPADYTVVSENGEVNTLPEAPQIPPAAEEGNADSEKAEQPKADPMAKQTILGSIQIKKINVDEVIVEGAQRWNLAVAIGHIPQTAALGAEGNCVLSGHRNAVNKKFFRHLNKLQAGDKITLKSGESAYTYTVTATKVVEPDDISVLKSQKGEYKLTLITCTPLYLATQRLIIYASLDG